MGTEKDKNKKPFEGVMKDLAGYMKPARINELLDRIRVNDSPHGLRNYALFLLLARSGRRISEVLAVKWQDIDFEEGTIIWNILKKKRDHVTIKTLDTYTLKVLFRYVREQEQYIYSNDHKLFPLSRDYPRKLMIKYCSQIGLYRIGKKTPHPHHFRHSFAVNYLVGVQRNEAIRLLQQELEHSSLNVTAQYLQFDIEDQRKIKEELFNKMDEE